MDWEAISLSVRLAACTVAALLVIGGPVAYWIARSRSPAKVLVQAVVTTPLILPPTVLGFYLLAALGPRSLLGGWIEAATGERIVFSFWGLLIGSVIFSAPFMVQPLSVAFGSVERDLLELSWSQGASRRATLAYVMLPLALPGIIAGSALTFAHTMGEFGVVLMVGGNIPGRTRTASVSVYDAVQSMDYERAGATAGVLLGISLVALIATFSFQRRHAAGSVG